MVVAAFKITETGPTPRNVRPHMAKIQRHMWDTMARHWHRYIRPKHFTPAGAAEYGYRPRTADYVDKKRKKYGHNDPLVFTGTSKRLSRIARITATSKGSKTRMSVPALNFHPSTRDELTRFSVRDRRVLLRVGDRDLGKSFREIRARRNRRLK